MPDVPLDPALPPDIAGWDRLQRPIWLFDPVSCRGLYANAAALELWGADSREELLARDFSQLSPAVRTRTRRLALATANGGSLSERWSFYPRGRPVTVQAMISSFPLSDGRSALLFEASAVEATQDELRAVEALRHTSSMISLFDTDGRQTFANPAAFAAYGGGERGFVDRFQQPEQGAAALAIILEGEVLAELGAVRVEGGARSHYLDARRVIDPVSGRASVLLTEQDVTAQVEAERALNDARQRAEVAEAKERFLANMSHELRTPLNSVLGFAGLLGDSGLDEARARHLGRITEAGVALSRIIDNVIDLAEIDAGEAVLEPMAFDPIDLLIDAMADIAPRAEAKGLSMRFDPPVGGRHILFGDAGRLRKVVDQFLANAVTFTDRGSVVPGLDLQPNGPGDMTVEISVIDTGPGLDAAARARLFRRFSPVDDSAGKRVGGSGLGLAVAKASIGFMGGEVGVDSIPGQGARFWIRLTLPRHVESPLGLRDAGRQDDGVLLRILYADDHEGNRVLVQALLASQGHRCETVGDGAQAVRAVREGAYDLVLMDIQMPVQDGVSATAEIRGLPGRAAATPILALTANTLSDQRKAYAAAGMNDCIAKPVNAVELIGKVAYWGRLGPAGERSAA
ncbi:MAG TPA: response regulator [Caulobacteraceae bacterium]|nr:response regulator [Caulobacteraceae bacterium]